MPEYRYWKKPSSRYLATLPFFDPTIGRTVRAPLGQGPGWWAGGVSAMFDPTSRQYYIYYRMRKPRELGRGVDCRIAVSDDGVSFRDIWQATKEELNTQSMEKACLFKAADRAWRLYLSLVGPDGRWRIEMVEAEKPDAFSVSERIPILDADTCRAEGVKDPHIYSLAGLLHMIVSYAPRPADAAQQTAQSMHGTGDVYNTGIVKSHSGLAISGNGLDWEWLGDILSPPSSGWDQYCTRINSVVRAGPVWVGLYDGCASVEENYEEKAGLCVSHDFRSWHRVTTDGPFVLSEHGSRSIRYIDVVPTESHLRYYYEWTRPDGSHELRTNAVEWQK